MKFQHIPIAIGDETKYIYIKNLTKKNKMAFNKVNQEPLGKRQREKQTNKQTYTSIIKKRENESIEEKQQQRGMKY